MTDSDSDADNDIICDPPDLDFQSGLCHHCMSTLKTTTTNLVIVDYLCRPCDKNCYWHCIEFVTGKKGTEFYKNNPCHSSEFCEGCEYNSYEVPVYYCPICCSKEDY